MTEPDSSTPERPVPSVPEDGAENGDDLQNDAPVPEDDPALLDGFVRSLKGEPDAEATEGTAPTPSPKVSQPDDSSDAAAIEEEPEDDPSQRPARVAQDQAVRTEAHHVAVELKRIEKEVRRLLDGRDTRRKRKLAGSYRWTELEDDIIAWKYAGRFDEETLRRLHELVCRRNDLFRRLRFLAGTRPIWNS
ncbi:MAG: hypothetical protein D6788_01105 [Planctomycetota bacterium]|nr:MAG: hypothetical protein D6788_01105 [Planctomycetota bacterium]